MRDQNRGMGLPSDAQLVGDVGDAARPPVGLAPAIVCLTEGWDLELESWGPAPGRGRDDRTLSPTTTVRFSGVGLGDWRELPASQEQLAELGVGSVGEVSGVGVYSMSLELAGEWWGVGAVVDLGHLVDTVMEVTVNGKVVTETYPFTSAVDLTPGLKVGANRLEVIVDGMAGPQQAASSSSVSVCSSPSVPGVRLRHRAQLPRDELVGA